MTFKEWVGKSIRPIDPRQAGYMTAHEAAVRYNAYLNECLIEYREKIKRYQAFAEEIAHDINSVQTAVIKSGVTKTRQAIMDAFPHYVVDEARRTWADQVIAGGKWIDELPGDIAKALDEISN